MQVSVQTRHVELARKERNALLMKVQSSLGRFAEKIQRIVFRLTDENGPLRKHGQAMRCVAEVVLVDGSRMTVQKRHNEPGGAVFQAMQTVRSNLGRTIGCRSGR